MRSKQFARFAAAILLVSGCQTMNAAADVPALLSEPDEASRAALRDTISAIFGGQDVPLADDALTKSSLLLIERNPRGSLDAPPATGRVLEEPIPVASACLSISATNRAIYCLTRPACPSSCKPHRLLQ
jgi:hypothetical protein